MFARWRTGGRVESVLPLYKMIINQARSRQSTKNWHTSRVEVNAAKLHAGAFRVI